MNKRILVTGASGGIGKAICRKLAKNNQVAIVGRSEARLRETTEVIERHGGKPFCIEADIAVDEAAVTIIEKTVEEFGSLDVLINNAGVAVNQRVEDSAVSDWNKMLDTNARAPFFLSIKAFPFLKQSSCATIVNISSVTGRISYPGQSIYSASKHAMHGWTKALAREWRRYGIRIHLLAPGGVATDMIRKMRPDLDESVLIHPEEIADIVKFLIDRRENAAIDEINIRRANSEPWQS